MTWGGIACFDEFGRQGPEVQILSPRPENHILINELRDRLAARILKNHCRFFAIAKNRPAERPGAAMNRERTASVLRRFGVRVGRCRALLSRVGRIAAHGDGRGPGERVGCGTCESVPEGSRGRCAGLCPSSPENRVVRRPCATNPAGRPVRPRLRRWSAVAASFVRLPFPRAPRAPPRRGRHRSHR